MYRRPPRSDELYHFGIKGMHWGIRRYQNKDGSLTNAGKKRYYEQNVKAYTKDNVDAIKRFGKTKEGKRHIDAANKAYSEVEKAYDESTEIEDYYYKQKKALKKGTKEYDAHKKEYLKAVQANDEKIQQAEIKYSEVIDQMDSAKGKFVQNEMIKKWGKENYQMMKDYNNELIRKGKSYSFFY